MENRELPAGPRSNSSQQYVSGSEFGSTAEPVNAKGVLIGIVKPPAGTVTTGAWLVVAVVTAQIFPELKVVKAIISSKLFTWK